VARLRLDGAANGGSAGPATRVRSTPGRLLTALRLTEQQLRAARDHVPLLQIVPVSFALRFVGLARRELLHPGTTQR